MGAPGPDRSITSWTSTWQYDGLLLKGSPITYHCPQRVFTLSGAAAGREAPYSSSSSIDWSREVRADLQQQLTRALNQDNPKLLAENSHTGKL